MRCVLRTALTRMLDLAAKWMKTKLSLLWGWRCVSPPVLGLDLAAKSRKTKRSLQRRECTVRGGWSVALLLCCSIALSVVRSVRRFDSCPGL